MSIEAVAWYLDQSEADGPRLLALLSLAERANDQGTCCPGMASIAKRLRRSTRTAQTIISELEQAGELLVVPGAGVPGLGGHTARYYLVGYIRAHGIEIPAEHIEASLSRERQRENGAKGQQARKSPNKGVQKPSPLFGDGNPKGAQRSSPLDEEKRGESLRKGVKVSAERGEGFCMEGVKVSAPKPLTTNLLTTKPTTNSGGGKDLDGSIAPTLSPATEPDPPPADTRPGFESDWSPSKSTVVVTKPTAPMGKSTSEKRAYRPLRRRDDPLWYDDRKLVNRNIPAGTGTTPCEVLFEFVPCDPERISRSTLERVHFEATDLEKWRRILAEIDGRGWRLYNITDRLKVYREGFQYQHSGNGATEKPANPNVAFSLAGLL